MQRKFSASSLVDFLFPWRSRRLAEQLGGQLAKECRADLSRQGCPGMGSMTIAAIRGYMRAQAGGCIESKLDEVMFRRGSNPALRARVAASAIDQLVAMAVRDVLNGERPARRRLLAA
jgi:hypothetical protein